MTKNMTDTALSLLSLREGQVAFDEDQKKAIVDVLRVRHASDADMAVFFHMARQTGLDPFRRQLYMIARQEYDSESNSKVWRQTFQTGIDGYRVIAERAARRMNAQLKKARFEYWDDEGNQTSAWWKTEPPAMIRATVQLGTDEPVIWDARFAEYVPLKDEYEPDTWVDGKKVRGQKTGKRVPQGMWATRPTAQLEKCAEAGALRRACPQDLSNVYVDAEMERDSEPSMTTLVDDGSAAAKGQRDWFAEVGLAASADDIRRIWRESTARGEKSPELIAAMKARGEVLAAEEKAAEPAAEAGPQETADLPTEQDQAAEAAEAEMAALIEAGQEIPDDGRDAPDCQKCGASNAGSRTAPYQCETCDSAATELAEKAFADPALYEGNPDVPFESRTEREQERTAVCSICNAPGGAHIDGCPNA